MRVLYAYPTTGFGHISRANELIPVLKKHVEVDILTSGPKLKIPPPYAINHHFSGLTFFPSSKGGINFWKTLNDNSILRLNKEIRALDVSDYDLVLSDFEPISAFATRNNGNVKCIELSHQCAVIHPKSPKPENGSRLGNFIIKKMCPSNSKIGFHFWKYDDSIHTPIIRSAIRKLPSENKGHYCVYLPAYSAEHLYNLLSLLPDVKWHIFSQQITRRYEQENCLFHPADIHVFTHHLTTCEGIICGAGFETPSEALFLGKKLLVIPMKNHYEQSCNGYALQKLGVDYMSKLTNSELPALKKWVHETNPIHIPYPDQTEQLVTEVLQLRISSKISNSLIPLNRLNSTYN
jgi:uncharacterized protein (TIGR00661 family)